MEFALQVRRLEKSYPVGFWRQRRRVLDGVNLELRVGQTVGLVGPNGSGKSTCLRICAGVERAHRGEVLILGSPPGDESVRARVGFLPEGHPFPSELSARAALELMASFFGYGRRESAERSERMLARAGLESAARVPLSRFSQGMYRRFGLAQAFLHQPDLVLLDEPTAGLDAAGHVLLDELWREARARGASFVIASHEASDLLTFADELVVLVEGRVALAGTPRDLAADPRGSDGRVRLEVEGLKAGDLDHVEREIARRGGRVAFRGPSADTFQELYRRAQADTHARR